MAEGEAEWARVETELAKIKPPSFLHVLLSGLLPKGASHAGMSLPMSNKTFRTILQVKLPSQVILICGDLILWLNERWRITVIIYLSLRVITGILAGGERMRQTLERGQEGDHRGREWMSASHDLKLEEE